MAGVFDWAKDRRSASAGRFPTRLSLFRLEERDVPAAFAVTSIADAGTGSLRAAIQSANSTVGTDTITFNLTGGPGSINLLSALPAINEEVVIDGTTQPTYAGVPLVTIDGTSAGAGSDGLVFAQGGASVVNGLAVVGFGGTAIHGTGAPGTANALTIQGNYIGILADGKTARGNNVGIRVEFNDGTIIGGSAAGEGNVVSGNTTGIALRAWDCIVQGNRIGTNAAGTVAVPNGAGLFDIGIRNIIGGSGAGEGNLVSGNSGAGLWLESASLGSVQGNRVGTDVTGKLPLPNALGISAGRGLINQTFGSFVIGGGLAGQGNTIAFNAGPGILVLAGDREVGILGNSIHSNTGLGIDLSGSGSADGPSVIGGAGANDMIRPPVLRFATSDGKQTTVSAELNGQANTHYRVEIFTGDAANASRYGEGKTFATSLNVVTDASGQATFSTTFAPTSVGTVISATATLTNAANNLTTNHLSTSEFSRVLTITQQLMASGAAAGGGPHVIVRNADATVRFSFYAYDSGFTGGVRVAVGDVNGDGVTDIITAPGPGGGPHVKVFDGKSGQLLSQFFAYANGYSGGVFIAAADVNGDGKADIITGAGAGGGPHVRVFSGADGKVLTEFFAFGAGFTGGVSVGGGDVDGDGKADIVGGAGPGGGPHVRVFSGNDGKVLTEFFAYGAGFAGGVNVAAGDVDGDGRADIVTGAGSGGGPHAKVFSGRDGSLIRSWFAYDAGFTGGVLVAAGDVTGDGQADIFTGTGRSTTQNARLRWFDGKNVSQLQDLSPYGNFLGGLFVG